MMVKRIVQVICNYRYLNVKGKHVISYICYSCDVIKNIQT